MGMARGGPARRHLLSAPRGNKPARAYRPPDRVGARGTCRGRRMPRPADGKGCPAWRPPPPPAPPAGRLRRPCRRSACRGRSLPIAACGSRISQRWSGRPGIVQAVAAVGGEGRIDAQPPRGFGEHADLVAGGGGEQQETLGHTPYCRAIVLGMKALVKSKREPGLWLEEMPIPKIGINDVRIKVLRTGICGTDVHIYKWNAVGAGHHSRADGDRTRIRGRDCRGGFERCGFFTPATLSAARATWCAAAAATALRDGATCARTRWALG